MSRWSAFYPRWPRPSDDPDPIEPHPGSGGDLSPGCPRCGQPVGEDRTLCEVCRFWEDSPDTEGE